MESSSATSPMRELGASQGKSHCDFGNVIVRFSCSSNPPEIPEIKFSGLCYIKAVGRAWVSWAGVAWPRSTGLLKEQPPSGACRCPGGDRGSGGADQPRSMFIAPAWMRCVSHLLTFYWSKQVPWLPSPMTIG